MLKKFNSFIKVLVILLTIFTLTNRCKKTNSFSEKICNSNANEKSFLEKLKMLMDQH